MPTINNSTKKTLIGVFDKSIFRIPKYQRAYSWEEGNWKELWDDINNNVIGQQREHFLGSIIYYHGDSNNSKYSHYEVIDGQQRLTTITILMRVIYEKLREKNKEVYVRFSDSVYKRYIGNVEDESFFLTLSKKDEGFFRDYIQKGNPTRKMSGKLVSNKNIRKCFDFFSDKINEIYINNNDENPEEVIWDLKEKIEENLIFVTIDVSTDVDAYTIFESINSKRQGLTTSDLLKNYIFLSADNYENNKPESKKLKSVEDSWDRMEQELEKIETSQYIRHYWISNFGKVFEKELYKEIKFKFQNNYNEVLNFFEGIIDEAERYSEIVGASIEGLTEDGLRSLEQLKYLKNKQYYPLLLSAIATNSDKVEISNLIRQISSVSVRRSITGKNPNELEKFFVDNAPALRRREISIGDIISKLLSDFWISDEEIKSQLANINFEDQEYLAKFILKEFEISKNIGEKTLGKLSLEHVMPRNPEKMEDWNMSESKHEELVWNIGNLVLIGPKYNSKMSNKNFTQKKKLLKMSDMKTTSTISQLEKWEEKEILEHNVEISSFVCRNWGKI